MQLARDTITAEGSIAQGNKARSEDRGFDLARDRARKAQTGLAHRW